ncbi:MAG: HDIG domain-containing protein, partial [Bacteroidota bacterium]|nr:HDIG domain-containing protein [Bacteroidota bacterium]
KSTEDLQAEKDSLLAEMKPYFNIQDGLRQSHTNEFRHTFPGIWSRFTEDNNFDSVYTSSEVIELEARYLLKATSAIDSLYRIGILPDLTSMDQTIDLEKGMVVVRSKVVQLRFPDQVVGPLESYQRLKATLSDSINLDGVDLINSEALFYALGLNRYIVSNLVYDQETTDAVQKSLLEGISNFRGLVQNGQRVIGRGEMVTEDKFIVLESYRSAYEMQTGDPTARLLVRTGQVVLILLCLIALFFFLKQFRPELVQSNLKMTFILLMMVLVVLAGSFAGKSTSISLFLVPFIILPVIMRAFFDSRLALFLHLIAMLLVGFLVPNGFEFIFIQVLAGFAAIVSFSHLHRRGQLVVTSLIVFLVYALIYVAMSITHEGALAKVEWINLAWLAGNAGLILFSYPLIYIFEKLFGFISDVTLIELSDSNHPLLRKLAEDAPGTFQHSMQVANLAESVIRVIGGNPLLARAGAMYHDIGKASNSMLFTENQVSGVNPHDKLERKESAGLIINHVIRGAEIARKHNLPKPVSDFILTHHGTSKTQYFLKMYQKENPDSEINADSFAYPGPRPFSKETAVLMMADSIEAASRSLSDYSEESLKKLIDSIIGAQLNEGQFEESDITFRNIQKAKEIFLSKLTNIYHARIQYPK